MPAILRYWLGAQRGRHSPLNSWVSAPHEVQLPAEWAHVSQSASHVRHSPENIRSYLTNYCTILHKIG